MTLKKGIFTIFQANVIALLINLLTSFFLPKYLSVEAYAVIKTFQLYITYIGVLHLGYADGMYLRYGGVSADKIKKEELAADIKTMRGFQLLISAAAALVCCVLKDKIWLAFAISIVPLNMASYYKLLCQATGEFKKYSSIMNMTTVFTFLGNLFLLFVMREYETPVIYIAVYVFLYYLIWGLCEINFLKLFRLKGIKGCFCPSLIKKNVIDGILLMLGNLSTAFLTGMDRWFVKCLMNTIAFAEYSFAVSIENFMSVAVTPISVTLYNFFCRNDNRDKLKKIKGLIYILAVVLPACAFPVKWIMENFLEKYLEASQVLFLLFAAQIFAIIVKCIYINLYKVHRKQNRYFIKLICVIITGFMLNAVCYSFFRTKEAFAIGTLLSNILWFILSVFDFPEIFPTVKEAFYIISEMVLFLITGYLLNAEAGFAVYVAGTVIFTVILMKRYLKYMLDLILKKSIF